MKVFVLVKFVDYEDSLIKGVVSTEETATKWTQAQILKLSGEDSVQTPAITILPCGYKYGDIGFIFEEFEIDKVKET